MVRLCACLSYRLDPALEVEGGLRAPYNGEVWVQFWQGRCVCGRAAWYCECGSVSLETSYIVSTN